MEELMEDLHLEHASLAGRKKNDSREFVPPTVDTFEIMNLHAFVPYDSAALDTCRRKKAAW